MTTSSVELTTAHPWSIASTTCYTLENWPFTRLVPVEVLHVPCGIRTAGIQLTVYILMNLIVDVHMFTRLLSNFNDVS